MKVGELISELKKFDSEMQIEIWEDAIEFPMAGDNFEINSVVYAYCRCQIVIDKIELTENWDLPGQGRKVEY